MATHVSPVLPVRSADRSMRGACRWAWATLVFFIIVVLEGAVVRATSSGAGCGDRWPLCNGEVLPHHPKIATVIEFAHRSLTGVSTLMFLVLIAWTFFVTGKGHPARRASVIAGLLLVSEALLGAVLVLKHWVQNNDSTGRVIMQSVHFTNTLLLLAATAVTAVLLGAQRPLHLKTQRLVWPSALALCLTVLTGATGSLAALADTIFPSPDLRTALSADFAANSPLLVRMRWMHPVSAILATLAALLLAKLLSASRFRQFAKILLANVVLQLAIGVADVALLAPTWLQVLHLFSADIFWITLVVVSTPILLDRAARQTLFQ